MTIEAPPEHKALTSTQYSIVPLFDVYTIDIS